jgi:uncharacterized protein (TIGR03067 family)
VFALLIVNACAQNSDDRDRLQGKWLFAGTVGNGKRTDATEKDKGKGILFSGDKYFDNSGEVKNGGTFKLDTTKKPKAIELTITGGAGKGFKVSFAYELDGDKLRLTNSLEGEYVPGFDSAKWLIQEFVREKK